MVGLPLRRLGHFDVSSLVVGVLLGRKTTPLQGTFQRMAGLPQEPVARPRTSNSAAWRAPHVVADLQVKITGTTRHRPDISAGGPTAPPRRSSPMSANSSRWRRNGESASLCDPAFRLRGVRGHLGDVAGAVRSAEARHPNGNLDLPPHVVGEGRVDIDLESDFPLNRLDRRENFLSLMHYFGLLSIREVRVACCDSGYRSRRSNG